MRFYTKSVLRSFRDRFYADRRKVVPISIGDLLDPMAVAVWFMDDGGRGARTPRGLVFNTSGFSRDEQGLLQDVLRTRFEIDSSVHTIGRGYQIYIKARSFTRFSDLVSPHLVTPM